MTGLKYTKLEYTKFDGVGVTNKLCLAWVNAEGTPADMNALAENPLLLKDVLAIIRGTHDSYEYLIDADAEPRIPWGREGKILHHLKMGMQRWSKSSVRLIDVWKEYGAARLRSGVPILRAIEDIEAEKLTSLNACFLEFLDRHPGVIPKEWRKYRRILFLNSRFEITGWMSEGSNDVVVSCLEPRERYGDWSKSPRRVDEWVLAGDAIAVLDKE